MQVSLELNEKSREREVNGLLKACKWLAAESVDIKVISVWKWLLE